MEYLSSLQSFGGYLIPFLVVLGIVVFVHEFGHFWVARRAGVKVETFSIGFGPEIFAWHDKYGTRWRVAWLPLGGYVKMFGDVDPTSFGPSEDVKTMTEEEKKQAFYAQPVSKRFAIVAAGPGANYLFATIVLAFLFFFNGQPYTETTVADVAQGSAAEQVGLMVGDKVLTIDGRRMQSFEEVRRVVALSVEKEVTVTYDRNGVVHTVSVVPQTIENEDRLGGVHKIGRLGITSTQQSFRDLGLVASVRESILEIGNITTTTLKGVGQMIMGTRGTDELGGPLRIAEMSGKMAEDGLFAFFWFIVLISVSLGLINLFPIPLLDGGHLIFYIAEWLRGRPLSERVQEYSARFGAVFVLGLMVFATWNDLVHLRVVSYFSGLFS